MGLKASSMVINRGCEVEGQESLGLTHCSFLKAWVWRPQTFMEAERSVRPRVEAVCPLVRVKEHTEVMAMKCQFCEREAVIGGCCTRCDKIAGDVEIELKQMVMAEMQGEGEGDVGEFVSDVNSAGGREHGTLCRPKGAIAPLRILSALRAEIDKPGLRPGGKRLRLCFYYVFDFGR